MTEGAMLPASAYRPSETPVVHQQRRERRMETSWPALIRLPTGTELPCIMRDVSKSGAKLSVPTKFALARTFLLKAEGRGFVFAVTLMWRRAGHAGVRIDKIAKIEVVDAHVASDDHDA